MSYVVRNQFTGHAPDGSRRYYKGGGGGSGNTYYANQDKLLGVQADIAQNMYNVYADYAPGRLQAMDRMVNEAMDGTLADRARATAAADAGASLGTSLAGAQRGLERYGTTLNPNALNANLTNTALAEGAMRSGAMNRAQQWAEGQKWARNADMYGALQGMPGTATQALGSAASGYGQMAGQQNQVNMANAMGYGQMGGMLGYGLFARDGGYIHEGEVVRRDDEPGYAMGGMPKLTDWRNYPTTQQNDTGTPSPVMQVASGMAPSLGMYGMKKFVAPYVKEGVGALKDSATGAWNSMIGTGGEHAANVAAMQSEAAAELAALQGAGDAAAITTPLAEQAAITGTDLLATGTADALGSGLAGATLETGGAMAAGELAGVGAAAGAEAAMAGTAAAGAEAALAGTAAAEAAGAASLMGPVGWAAAAGLGIYALGSGMDWWADGGPVPKHRGLRKDMRPGGPVNGPGTETSDSIPAWLSDGEYVINADAVKEHGKTKLEKINEKGLKKRKAKAKAAAPKAAGMKKPVKK